MNSGGLASLVLVALLAGCVARGLSPEPAPTAPVPSVPPAPAAAPVLAAQVPATEARAPARLQPVSSPDRGAAPRCLAQIEDFAERHSGTRVILGPAAFADGDELVLARIQRRGADGRLLDGRAAPPLPVVLKLLASPAGCIVRLADAPAAEAALPACTCTALPR